VRVPPGSLTLPTVLLRTTLGTSGFVATESAKTKWVALLIDPDLCV
jgi:hypothetical protein